MFITIEGIDGVGKSTQTKILGDNIDSIGAPVIETHEPGGTPYGMRIREIIKSEPNISLKSQFHLIESQRTHHVNNVILPALKAGFTVICDRFIDTSYVYQHGYMTEDQWEEYITTYEVVPDLTIILFSKDVAGLKKRMMERQGIEMDHFDNESVEKLIEKQRLFFNQKTKYPNRVQLVDADLSQEEVAQEIWNLANKR